MKIIFIVFLGALLTSISSCIDHEAESAEREQIIAEGVQIKVSEFHQREWEKCIAQARAKAVQEVDSLIRATAKQQAIEPVIKPPKPERPVKPEIRMLPDTVRPKAGHRQDTIRNY
jgi:hypothetical protein